MKRSKSDEAKIEKRRRRNREAAQKCREKKNAQIVQLEADKERKLKIRQKVSFEIFTLTTFL